jgi:hypothetical protein
MQKDDFLSRIQSNISEHGYHVTVVSGGALPRFAYTIGCKNSLGAEFIFAGGEYYSQVQLGEIIAEIVSLAKKKPDWLNLSISITPLGTFSISKADASWSKLLLLGAFDYYNQPEIEVWQILPDGQHHTLDIPNMSQAFDIGSEPVWQWLSRKWDYPIPNTSMAVSNLQVLFGAKATEVTRWEKDEWEIFAGAGPDVQKEDMRIVPMGILLGIDKSLEPAAHLAIGKGIWRDNIELEWNEWG